MRKIKKGDKVQVIAGKSKGKVGVVSKVISTMFKDQEILKVVVEGCNLIKKTVKRNPEANEQGGIVTLEAPMDCSNVAIVNPKTGKADRVGFKLQDGKKVRFFKSTGDLVENVG